ncbi:MAG TPA: bL28 family ribosomal protein [Patescibacteria group bacterium]|nr:bL28 family ribosomal protein [Patescibacteria group bacterium]
MSRICDLCGRGSRKFVQSSHANNKTLTRKLINLQVKTVDGVRKKVCTRCIKTMKKVAK